MTRSPAGGPRVLSEGSPGNWVTLQARHAPERRCFVTGDGTVHTFGAVNARVNRLARALQAYGLGRGDRIGILATDSVDYMVLLMASLKLGTTFVPYNYRFAEGEILALAKVAPLDAFVVGPRYAGIVPSAREACPALKLVASFGAAGGLTTLDDLVGAVDDDSNVEVATEAEDIVSIMFTSGTTGFPKGVMQSARMLSGAATAAMIDLRLQPQDFRYSAAAMFHVAGLGYALYGVARGFCSLVLEQYRPETLLHWIAEGGLTGMVAMPTMLRTLLDTPGMRDRSYPTLTDIIYGGSPMDPGLLRELLAVFEGCRFYNSFGAGTEAFGQSLFTPEDHVRALAGEEHLLGSVGKPSWGVELRLCDEEMRDVPDGSVGAICVRSNTVMSGYYDDPVRTVRAVRDGWFSAGDLARRDDEGYLFLAGRATDMIIRGGENVYPVEIEETLLRHAAVAATAVVGVPDDVWGEIVVAAVELAHGHEGVAVEDELRAHCRRHLAAYKVPVRIEAVAELPRNVNGKVRKFVLRDELARGSQR